MLLAGVFTPNPHEGTGSKGLEVMRIEVPGDAGHLFFIYTKHINRVSYMGSQRRLSIFIDKGKKMKYLMTVFAGIVLSLSFVACGEDDSDTGSTDVEVVDAGTADASQPSDAQDAGEEADSGNLEDTGTAEDAGE